MNSQKHLFQLPEGIHYLNCAYMSPLLKSVEEKGIEGMRLKRNPLSIKPADFFTGAVGVRQKFGRMVWEHSATGGCDALCILWYEHCDPEHSLSEKVSMH